MTDKKDIIKVCKELIQIVPDNKKESLNKFLNDATQSIMYTAPEALDKKQHEILYRLVKLIQMLNLDKNTLKKLENVLYKKN